MRWGLPHPWLSLALLLAWLALNQSLHPAHWLLGALFAWLLPALAHPLLPDLPRLRRKPLAAKLVVVFLWDIVLANIQVARLILGPVSRLRTAFFYVPMDAESELARALLAGMITMTPGTLSVAFEDGGRRLLVHTLDLPDEAATVADIKQRYEQPLIRIFEADA
jgi:multicomponent K+:H+ antiporter subunit E